MKPKLFHRNFSLLIARTGQFSSGKRDPGRSGSFKNPWEKYLPDHRRPGILSYPAGNFIPSIRESLYPIWNPGVVFCAAPAGCLWFFHFCHLSYPETDSGKYDGKGFRLYKRFYPVYPAPGADPVRISF